MKFWARIFAAGFASAALISAAQFGVVYGLGALRLNRDFAEADGDWNIQLTWIAWFILTAVVGGGAYAAGLSRLLTKRLSVGIGVRLVAASAAGLGAGVASLPLTVYPAIDAKLGLPVNPAITVAFTVCAALAVGIGMSAIIAGNAPMTTNVAYFTFSIWVLAVVSISEIPPLFGRLYLEQPRLGVLDISTLEPIPRASFSMPVLAAAVGILVAIVGRARRQPRILIALSGTAGPLLAGLAYLLSGPGPQKLTGQADGYLGAMIAVVVGLTLSTIIALLPRSSRERQVYPTARSDEFL
ncbi:hypothetical protein Rhe02_23930 [Rhizocola hellebori]|uniref:Uncharacterized protein n=1 Tax=Rhizocola hellebori TaxID=1392758 RepID=A0A8J3Q6R0_9ACTN|nr:hypothetical protein [Rhizocola hellebori]GIH04326.1 hypothetical protein Rhe02_23930 [Rhizocola hellebori]